MITLSILNISSSAFWIETVNHLWQSTLFGLFIALLLIFFKKGDAGTRYIIGWVALLKFILPSSLFFLIFVSLKPVSNYEVESEIVPATPSNINIAEPFILINQPGTLFGEIETDKNSALYRGLPSLDMLGIIWLGVGLLIFGRWSYVLCRFLREIKSNSHPFSDSLNKKLHQLRDKIRLRKPVSGYLINCNIEPGSFGLISPRIIIPAGLIKELTPGELELVLLHELFHIKHKDNIWSFLQKLFSCAFWFNPIVWWFNRHLIWESEKICDEGVLNFSECNSTYAESILKVTRYCVGRKILGYSGMNDFDLKNRIENIVSFNRKGISKDALNRFLIVIVVTFLVITTAASGFLIHSVKPSFNIFEAYNQNFFSGRHRFDQRGHPGKQSEEDLMAAMKHFKEAIALNPNNALAYSGLTDVYNFLPEKVPGINKDDVRAQAEEAVKKALALDPNLAEAHASSGYYKFVFQNDFYGAERDFQRAIELNPEYVRAHHFYAGILRLMGHNDEALAERRIVYELEPNSPHYSGTLAVELAFTRQYDDAINQFQRTIELDSDQVITWFVLGETYLYVNKFEDATRAFVRFAELTGENKEVMQQYVSLIEEHKRSGEPVSPPPELVKELSEIAG